MMMNNLPDTPDLRILLIKLRHHGDMLLTTPVINSLRQKWPQAQIDVLLYEETRDMLAAHPAIGTLYGIDRKWKQLGTLKHLQKEWQLLRALRKQHYHLVINLADQWRSAIVTRFTGAPVRLGFAFNKRNNAFWRICHSELVPVANHPSLHTVEQNLSILSPLPVPAQPAVTMAYTEEDWQRAHQKLVQNGVGERYIVIQPTSRWFFKCWDEDKMAQTITALQQDGHTVVLTAGPDKKELAMIERILAGGSINATPAGRAYRSRLSVYWRGLRADAYGRRAADALRGAVWSFQTDVLVSMAGQRPGHLGWRLRPAARSGRH